MRDVIDPDWLELLRAEVAKPGKTVASVAREIGMKRPSLSLLLSGNYPASLTKVQEKHAPTVRQLFSEDVFCPHVQKSIAKALCKENYERPMTNSTSARLRQFMAFRDCPIYPTNQPDQGADQEEN